MLLFGGSEPFSRPPAVEEAVRESFDAHAATPRPQQRPPGARAAAAAAAPAPSYQLWADGWDSESSRMRPLAMLDASELLLELVRARGPTVRVLDLGCGEGAFLADAHARAGLPWSQLAGVSAEDERLRDSGTGEPLIPDSSYALANLETLGCPSGLTALEALGWLPFGGGGSFGGGMSFDLIVSWSTWWHLVDPLGSLALAHDRLLSPGGLLVLHGVPLSHLGPEGDVGSATSDLAAVERLHRALTATLGERVALVVQHESVSGWVRRLNVTWLHCKRQTPAKNAAGPALPAAAAFCAPNKHAGGGAAAPMPTMAAAVRVPAAGGCGAEAPGPEEEPDDARAEEPRPESGRSSGLLAPGFVRYTGGLVRAHDGLRAAYALEARASVKVATMGSGRGGGTDPHPQPGLHCELFSTAGERGVDGIAQRDRLRAVYRAWVNSSIATLYIGLFRAPTLLREEHEPCVSEPV